MRLLSTDILRQWRVSAPGLALGLLFLGLSLTPSLIPKTAVQHGLIGGASMAFGYLLVISIVGTWRYLELPEVRPAGRWGRVAWLVVGLTGLVWGLIIHRPGQADVRAIMSIDPIGPTHEPVLLVLALIVFGLLYAIGLGLAGLTRRINKRLATFVPPRVSMLASMLAVVLLSWYISNGLIFSWTISTLDAGLQEIDALIDPDTPSPNSPLRSGNAESLIGWDTLGAQGREFAAGGRSGAEIAAFHPGKRTLEPIRIYAGLNSAETIEARAQLVLDEMIRTNAFDRSIVVVVTPTGTGWIDQAAVDPLEVIHRGDTAIVGMQYSYLLSPLALLVEAEVVHKSAAALARVVHAHWRDIPEETRPKLYLHGLSLGSYGSEQAFSLISLIDEPIDGALWSGPSYENSLWKELTRNRNPDSIVWLPEIGDGRTVRFTTQENALDIPGTHWPGMRIAYLQYPSDPITFFEIESAIRPSAWMTDKRAPDVSDKVRWYPIVTMLQLLIDMPASSDVPAGFGHHFAPEHYIDAWLALTEPGSWTEAETKRLKVEFR